MIKRAEIKEYDDDMSITVYVNGVEQYTIHVNDEDSVILTDPDTDTLIYPKGDKDNASDSLIIEHYP